MKTKTETKITMLAENLTEALAGHVVEDCSTIPILDMARIQGARVITSDLDLFCLSDVNGFGKGDMLVNCRKLLAVVEKLTGMVTLECIDEGEDNLDGRSRKRHVRMTHGTSVFRFETMVLANFPIIPDAPLLTLEIARFRTILERVFFATSNYESSYVLNGALMKITSGKLELIATDGHRMNLAEMPIDAPDIKPVLLSRSALEWIIKSGESDVSFGIGDQFHAVRAGSKTLIFRYKTGQFPNYEAVIPSKTNITATFKSTREFKKKLALVSEFSDPRSGAVIFNFGHESTVSAKSADVGSATTTLDCAVDGELRIGVCSTYVFDILNTVEDEELTVQFTNEQSAAMFILDGTRYIVMPMRI